MSSCWTATDLGGDFGPNVSLSLVDDAYLLSVSTDGAFGRMEFSSVVDIVEGLVIPLSGASEGAGTNAGLIVLSPLATVLSGTVLSADGTQPEAVYANLEFLDGIIWLDDPSSALLIRGGEFAIAAPVPVNQAVLYRIDFSFFDVGLQSWSFLSREFRLNVDGTHDFAPYEGITNKLPASEKWIVVPPSSRVSGIARVPDGTPAGGSTFSVERWDSSQQAWDRSGALVGTSDSAGRFAVDLVTPGDYRFRITSPWNGTIGYREIYGHVHVDEDFSFQVCASDRVTCSAASTLDLSFVDPSLRIRLVTQPGGQPVADAWTQIERWNSETNAWEWRDQSSVSGQGRTGFPVTSGDYRIYVQPRTQGVRGGVAFWEYLHVNAESNTTCIADETRACAGPESPGEIEIPLRTSNVTITVNDAGGTPVTGNALIVWSTGGFWTSGYTGPTGEVALHLPDGTYQAEVHPRWGSSSSLPARLRIVVSSGAVGSWGYLSGPAEAETFEQQCSGVPCSVIVGLDRIAPNVSGLVTARSFPAIGAFVIARDSANRVVSRSVSDVVGAFTLSLPPGSIYSITATAVSAGIARSTSVQCDLVAAPECPSLSLALFGDPL